MELYLMRHAEAVSRDEWIHSDRDRPLSELGRARLTHASGDISRVLLPSHIVSSPYVRAVQTAQFFSNLFSIDAADTEEDLESGTTPKKIRNVVLNYKEKFPLLLVGHMPDLLYFAIEATGNDGLAQVGMQPGEVIALELGNLERKWGQSLFLWRRTLNEWGED